MFALNSKKCQAASLMYLTLPKYTTDKIAQSNLGTGRVATSPTHHPKPQLRQFTHFGTVYYAANSPMVTMGKPTFTHKISPFHGQISKTNYLPYPWIHPTYHPKMHPYPISHFVTMHWTDRHTNQQMVGGMFDDYRLLMLYREWRRGLKLIYTLWLARQSWKDPNSMKAQQMTSNNLLLSLTKTILRQRNQSVIYSAWQLQHQLCREWTIAMLCWSVFQLPHWHWVIHATAYTILDLKLCDCVTGYPKVALVYFVTIQYKLCLLVDKSMLGHTSEYISDLLTPVAEILGRFTLSACTDTSVSKFNNTLA